MLEAGFVILNYNDYKTVYKLIDNIKKYSILKKIVIVDNKSTDNSFEMLKKLENELISVIQSDKNGGYSYGNNVGIKWLINNTNVDIIFVANPDIQVSEKNLRLILNYFDTTDYAMLAPVMEDINGNYKIEKFRLPTYYYDLFSYTYILQKLYSHNIQINKDNEKKEIIEVEMLPGSFFAIKTNVIKDIDFFDDNTFLFCEERIIGNKLKSKNYKIGLITNIRFIHMHSVSIKKSMNIINTWKIMNKSRMYYNIKYNKIGIIKKLLLAISMAYFMIRLRVYLFYKDYIKSYIQNLRVILNI